VFEGESRLVADNHCLGTFYLRDLVPRPIEDERFKVTFEVDENGIMNITAEDTAGDSTASVQIKSDKGRLSEAQINQMKENAVRFKWADEGYTN